MAVSCDWCHGGAVVCEDCALSGVTDHPGGRARVLSQGLILAKSLITYPMTHVSFLPPFVDSYTDVFQLLRRHSHQQMAGRSL